MDQSTVASPDLTGVQGGSPLANVENGRIELSEYSPVELDRTALSEEQGLELWRRYEKYVSVEFPSPRNDHRWRLISQGAVGFLPVSDELSLTLAPKVDLESVFRMLEYAYDLDLRTFDGLLDCSTVNELFGRIANILAQRVLDRARRGLYRSYVAHEEDLRYVRGTIDLRRAVTQPWRVRLDCRFDEHTADIEDNRLLAWTLHQTARTGAILGNAQPNVHLAHRIIRSAVSTTPQYSAACAGRLYNRLNDDYEPMHALCRFLLDTIGPTHERGDRDMLPFVVDMARLFEKFVFSWLRKNLPSGLSVTAQETVWSSTMGSPRFEADLVIRDSQTEKPHAVLDTKYKVHEGPVASDIQQVVAYATALGCDRAYLIYPRDLTWPLDESVGGVSVRSATFSLTGDADTAGRKLLARLQLDSVPCERLKTCQG